MALAFAPTPQTAPPPRRWTADEFARMHAAGLFDKGERVELRAGEVYVNGRLKLWTTDEHVRLINCGAIYEGEPSELFQGRVIERIDMNPPHSIAVTKTADVLKRIFGAGFFAREEKPLTLTGGSRPQPDIVIVAGVPDDYSRHPTAAQAYIVVEVSDTTLAFDRGDKMWAYASAGVTDYWVLDLNARQLEVYRGPFENGYLDVTIYAETESVAPLAASQSDVSVADLLPLSQTL